MMHNLSGNNSSRSYVLGTDEEDPNQMFDPNPGVLLSESSLSSSLTDHSQQGLQCTLY